ncbi:MAG: bifunctional glutamate N-acetyltransferase/amino-acid acetyltransferase ArgJ [Thermodesulfovibrionales bacterium]
MIESIRGFRFSATEASIKRPGRKDIALIYSESVSIMAGLFTRNRVKAAPVRLDMRRIKSGKGQAIILNSGNANACIGERGLKDAEAMADLIAEGLGLNKELVYVCSTGVIGTPMPMERIRASIPTLIRELGQHGIMDVASAIMTTDTFPKVTERDFRIGKIQAKIAGICKGAGMIRPDMATMLCFILTDLNITHSALNTALRKAVNASFNRITVDGDMSTNDTVLAMANGKAGNRSVIEGSKGYKIFESILAEITMELSRMIVRDGEGATKVVEITVKNARNDREAKKAAYSVANSLLVKTALYGNDANWGRIMASLGYSGIPLKEENIDIFMNGIKIVSRGLGTGRDRNPEEIFRNKEVKILIDLRMGKGTATVLTCDLSEDYVRINAEYRT